MHVQMHVCAGAHVSGGAGSKAPCAPMFFPPPPQPETSKHITVSGCLIIWLWVGLRGGGPGPFMILDVAPVWWVPWRGGFEAGPC